MAGWRGMDRLRESSSCVLLISRAPAGTFKEKTHIRVSGVFRGRPCDRNIGITVPLSQSDLSGFAMAERPAGEVHPGADPEPSKEIPNALRILAYHVEADVMSWTPEQDAAVMTGLLGSMTAQRAQAARTVGAPRRTKNARTLRGPGAGMVIDGPFAETKEQLLGFIRGLRQRGRRDRDCPRPAPRQSVGGLRDPLRPRYLPGRHCRHGDARPFRVEGTSYCLKPACRNNGSTRSMKNGN